MHCLPTAADGRALSMPLRSGWSWDNPNTVMVIKFTIPVGDIKRIREKTDSRNIILRPEFLRESKALYDKAFT